MDSCLIMLYVPSSIDTIQSSVFTWNQVMWWIRSFRVSVHPSTLPVVNFPGKKHTFFGVHHVWTTYINASIHYVVPLLRGGSCPFPRSRWCRGMKELTQQWWSQVQPSGWKKVEFSFQLLVKFEAVGWWWTCSLVVNVWVQLRSQQLQCVWYFLEVLSALMRTNADVLLKWRFCHHRSSSLVGYNSSVQPLFIEPPCSYCDLLEAHLWESLKMTGLSRGKLFPACEYFISTCNWR